MNRHCTETDLLEAYYAQPGDFDRISIHLSACAACASRYAQLEQRIREITPAEAERPETFWTRQRISVMRRIASQRRPVRPLAYTLRVAAGATLAFVLGGALVYESMKPHVQPAPASAKTATVVKSPAAEHDQTGAHDAWQSEELKEFHTVVDWESWGEPQKGDQL